MKLKELYKERDIPGWHEPNVTEKAIWKDSKGKVIGAYFPEVDDNIKYLLDYIIESSKVVNKSFIPHVYGNRQLESIFFGALRTDGSIGRHCPMISAIHKEESNTELLTAISYLSDVAVEFASQDPELKVLFDKMKIQQRTICDSRICISDHYTSGSVNFNGLLGLHYDTASLPGVYNIILYKRDGEGGNLIIPNEELVVDAKSYSMAILNVRENLHGVTEFRGRSRDCIVFYAVNQTA